MRTRLEVLFTPAEFAGLRERDLGNTTCVVFDVLRATTTMITALVNGASAIIPAADIKEALEIRSEHPEYLLAGERNGVRIRADLTGGIDFDFGNSPREFTPERVAGRTVVMTTTNGTRALRAASGAKRLVVGAFTNLGAVVADLEVRDWDELLLVCGGTLEQASIEDTLAAGALCHRMWSRFEAPEVSDSAQIARELYLAHRNDLYGAMKLSRNGRRLLGMPELKDDVRFCLKCDTVDRVGILCSDGAVRLT